MTRMLTTAQAAQHLGIQTDSVAHAIRRGLFKGAKKKSRWLVPLAAVDHYAQHHAGGKGRFKGQKTSPVRRVVELRLQRVGSIRAPELAEELEVTRCLITLYLREIGARYSATDKRWYAK